MTLLEFITELEELSHEANGLPWNYFNRVIEDEENWPGIVKAKLMCYQAGSIHPITGPEEISMERRDWEYLCASVNSLPKLLKAVRYLILACCESPTGRKALAECERIVGE